MLLTFTDALTKDSIAVNPAFVTAVFLVPEGDNKGKTVIGVTNGSIMIEESYIETVGRLNGELK
jgi:hypothetical protein